MYSAVTVGKNAHPTTKPTAWRWVRNPPYDCFFNNLNALLTTSNELNAMPNAESEKSRSLVIGCAIILIEFTMNTSYFFGEIGGDLQGIFLSVIAALVPTALLIAETYMLSQTKFDIYASEELIARVNQG